MCNASNSTQIQATSSTVNSDDTFPLASKLAEEPERNIDNHTSASDQPHGNNSRR